MTEFPSLKHSIMIDKSMIFILYKHSPASIQTGLSLPMMNLDGGCKKQFCFDVAVDVCIFVSFRVCNIDATLLSRAPVMSSEVVFKACK